jgi:hypothetical protein
MSGQTHEFPRLSQNRPWSPPSTRRQHRTPRSQRSTGVRRQDLQLECGGPTKTRVHRTDEKKIEIVTVTLIKVSHRDLCQVQ